MGGYYPDKPDNVSRLMQPVPDPIPSVKFWADEPYDTLDPGDTKTWTIDHSSVTEDLYFINISLVSVDLLYCDMTLNLNSSAIFHDVATLISKFVPGRSNPLIIKPSDTLAVVAYNRNAVPEYLELWAVAYEVG